MNQKIASMQFKFIKMKKLNHANYLWLQILRSPTSLFCTNITHTTRMSLIKTSYEISAFFLSIPFAHSPTPPLHITFDCYIKINFRIFLYIFSSHLSSQKLSTNYKNKFTKKKGSW